MKINLNNYEAFLLDYLEDNLNEKDLNELKTFAVLHPELNIDFGKNELPYFSKDNLTSDFKSDLFKSEENLTDEQVIAYLEGTLSQSEKQKFEKELETDKTLAAQFKLYKEAVLKADNTIVFENKYHLLKNEDELLLSNQALLYVENLLQEPERNEFEGQVKTNSDLKSELELFTKTKLKIDFEILHPDKESLKKESRVVVLFSLRTVVAVAAGILLIVGLGLVFKNFNSNPEFTKELSSKNSELPENHVLQKKNSDSIKSVEVINQIVPHKVYLAKKTSHISNALKLKKDTLIINENNEQYNNVAKEEAPLPEIINTPVMKSDTVIVTNHVKEETKILPLNSNIIKQSTLLAFESDDEEISQEDNDKKPGFWKRAARLAKQANGLGLKAVNGEEKSGDRFSLSFNAFSIEKK